MAHKLISKRYPTEYAGQTMTFPHIGEATFEKDGSLIVDADKHVLTAFFEDTKESFDFQPEGAVSEEKKAKNKKKDENEELKQKLAEMSTNDLLELCKDAGFNPDEAAAWSDARIRKELLKKMSE